MGSWHGAIHLPTGDHRLAVEITGKPGAYAGTVGIIIQLLIGPWVGTSIYDIKPIDFDFNAVMTNTTPVAAYRGAGRPEAIYLIEHRDQPHTREIVLHYAGTRRP